MRVGQGHRLQSLKYIEAMPRSTLLR
jgi:hypothetical protein